MSNMSMQNSTATGDSRSDFDVNIGRIAMAFARLRGLNQGQLAAAIGVSSPTMSGRIRGSAPWQAWEIQAMASVLDREPGDFYRDPDELLRSRCFAPSSLLSVLDGGNEPDDTPPPTLRVVG